MCGPGRMAHAVLGVTVCEKPNSSSSSADARQLRIINRKLSVAVLAVSTVHSIQSTLERAVGGQRMEPYVSSLGAYTLEKGDGIYSATPKDPFTPLFSIEDVIFSAIRFAKSQVLIILLLAWYKAVDSVYLFFRGKQSSTSASVAGCTAHRLAN